VNTPVRWGVIGTANIARAQFLPALRAAGAGVASYVASRDGTRAETWAAEHGVNRGVEGYESVVTADDVDAIYIALPNHLHAEWATAAVRAGKAVLCEKPLCTSVAETEELLRATQQSNALVWEAFVFPFHQQFLRLRELIDGGAIGELREIQSNFYFRLRNRQNIRFSPEMYGGAVNDVGCYAVRLAQLLFAGGPAEAVVMATWAPEGVDEETQAVLDYPDRRRLMFGCGLSRPLDTFTRFLGTDGEIRTSNPFHPSAADTMEIRAPGVETVEHPTDGRPSFTGAIEHIHAVLRGVEAPRHLASDDSLVTARALEMLHSRMHDSSS
jgi:predicted dehydrogenase